MKNKQKIAFIYMNNARNIGRGAGYVAASIKKAGYYLSFIDTKYNSDEKIVKNIVNNDFDILMVSTITLFFNKALKIINEIKKEKDIPVLIGGIHATILKEKILEENPNIDFCCVGEGESMVIDFLKYIPEKNFDKVPNLIYRNNGKIIKNDVKEPEDLSLLPPFPWDLFKKEQMDDGKGFLYVTCTRGCPFNCSYCCNSVYLKLYKNKYLRTRPVDQVINELLYLKGKFNPPMFYFGDEMLLFDNDYVKNLFSHFKKRINKRFGLMGRVEFLKEDIVEFLAKCGCKYIGIGVECGDEKFAKEVLNRKITNKQIENCINIIKKNKIIVTTFNMIGYHVDYDDRLTLKTLLLNKELNPDYSQVSIFYPFPGTKLFDICESKKLIKKDLLLDNYYNESILKDREHISKIRDIMDEYLNKDSKINWVFLPLHRKIIKLIKKIILQFYKNLKLLFNVNSI